MLLSFGRLALSRGLRRAETGIFQALTSLNRPETSPDHTLKMQNTLVRRALSGRREEFPPRQNLTDLVGAEIVMAYDNPD